MFGLGKAAAPVSIPGEKPKVLIGVSAFHGVCPEAQENFFAFAYECGRRCPEYDFFLKIAIKREQFRARNNLVELALVNECQYLLMLDDDHLIPPDLFSRLVKHQKPIVGVLYYQRGGAYHPVVMRSLNKKDGLKGIQFLNHFDKAIRNPGLHEVDVVGGGCMLMETEIFRKIPQPYFWVDGIVGTDVHLCEQLRKAKVPIFCDTSIEIGHLGEPQIVTSRTIPQYGRTLGEVNEDLWNDLKAYYTENETELEASLIRAAGDNDRKKRWEEKPRDTWEGVRDYYQSYEEWHVRNLAAYCLGYDEARAWFLTNSARCFPREATVADYGAGIGYLTIPGAGRMNYRMTALDLPGPTMKFMEWRIGKHDLGSKVSVVPFETPIPPDLPEPVDAVVMISVFDHLWDPMGALDWVDRNLKQGGYFLCDTYNRKHHEDEPQHIVRFDAHKMPLEFRRRGLLATEETHFVFRKER